MTGMGGSDGNDPAIVHAFHQTLLYQGFIVAGLLLVVLVAGNVLRSRQLRRSLEGPAADGVNGYHPDRCHRDAPARRLLRIGLGLLWILDGVLQGQAAMPGHLVPDVILPAANGSPNWVVSLVTDAARVWTGHQVTAAAATVWIQIGLGLWLLVAPRGRWSRAAGGASAVWGLIIWVIGESLGGILAPGLSWLEGAPGAALLYVAAGALIAVPDRCWTGPELGRAIGRAAGVTLVGFAVLQAWPGRDAQGDLGGMAHDMAHTPQPGWLHTIVESVADHAGPANLATIIAMLIIGTALVGVGPARPRLTAAALGAAVVLCLATWVTVQDLGFLGGVGTDPNSMLPWLLLLATAGVAMTRPAQPRDAEPTPPWRAKMNTPAYALRTFAAIAAVAVIVIGAAPLTADTITTAGPATGPHQPPTVRSQSGCLPCTTSPGASTLR